MTKSKRYGVILIFLIIFHVVNNYIWLKNDCESIHGCCDVVHHTNRAVLIYQGLREIFSSGSSCKEKFLRIWNLLLFDKKEYSRWPTLVPFSSASVSLLFKDTLLGIRFSNILYFVIIIIACYFVGSNLHSKEAGLFSACVVSLYPAIFGSSRKFGLDFPLVAIVVLSLYFLLKSEAFKNPLYSTITGVCFGIGMLIKFQFFIFFMGPLIYVLHQAFGDKTLKFKKVLWFTFILFLGSLISLIWWHKIFLPEGRKDIILRFLYPVRIIFYHRYYVFMEAFKLSIKGMFLNLSPIFFLMFLVGIFFYLRNMNRNKLFLLLWIVIPYICFTFVLLWGMGGVSRRPEFRHLFPIYPAIALASVVGWLESPIKSNRLKILLLLIFLLTGVCQFFILSYSTELPFIDSRYAHPPEKNNHLMVMDKFNHLIQQHKTSDRNIGIIETSFFNNDECVRLSYFLKLLDAKNNIFLSAEGVLPTRISDEFLYNVDIYDFLIAFSTSSKPDFSALMIYSQKSQKKLVEKAIEKFKKFKILKQDVLFPEKVNIFLLERNDIS
ncbi:glycosyltransferase family 39 protein [bacterium]|nr:glycosyltransferase family 39 protein [bacterium]